MNPGYMSRMSSSELDEFAKALGISAKAEKTAQGKAALIDRRRNRRATVRALGMELSVPVKRFRDKRVTDLLGKGELSDEDTEAAMRLVLGEEQFDEVVAACTDEDGTVDVSAMGFVFVKILTSAELKNF